MGYRVPAKNRARLAAFSAVASQNHTSRCSLGDQLCTLVRDFTLDVADHASPADDFAFGFESGFPNRAEEVDLQLDRCEGFAGGECACKGDSHRGVGDVAQYATVK